MRSSHTIYHLHHEGHPYGDAWDGHLYSYLDGIALNVWSFQ